MQLHGGKGKGKEKGKEKGGREIFRPGQRANSLGHALSFGCVWPRRAKKRLQWPPRRGLLTSRLMRRRRSTRPFRSLMERKHLRQPGCKDNVHQGGRRGLSHNSEGLQGPQATQQGPIGPQPQHEPQGAEGATPKAGEGATPKAAPATEGAAPAAGSTASQAVYAPAAADDEPHGGDQAEPAGEPGLPDDGPRRRESNEVPRPTIFTAALGTVYHVRPSCS